MSEAVKRASFAIEDMVQGGGNLWGSAGPVRATIVGGAFTKEAPDGYTSEGNPIFAKIDFLLAGDAPIEDRSVSQSFPLGATSGDNFAIDGNGDYLVPTNNDAHIVKDSKFGTFASSLQNEGVPKAILSDFAFTKIIGLDGDFKRIADKERNFVAKPGEVKKKFPPSTLCLIKLHALSGQKAVAKTNGAVTSAVQTTAPASTGDLDSDTLEVLKGVLASGPVQRGRLTLAVSKAAMGNPERQALARRAAEESFITEMVTLGMLTYASTEKGQPVGLAS